MVANSKEKVWQELSAEEIRLALMWYEQDGKSPKELADLLHRDKSTMTRLLVKKVERKKDGRPPALTTAQIDALEKKAEAMIDEADGEWRVTVWRVKATMRLKASCRTILEAVHARGRRQEKKYAPSFRESRADFKRRLRRTAKRLPSWLINSQMQNVNLRCDRSLKAEGVTLRKDVVSAMIRT